MREERILHSRTEICTHMEHPLRDDEQGQQKTTILQHSLCSFKFLHCGFSEFVDVGEELEASCGFEGAGCGNGNHHHSFMHMDSLLQAMSTSGEVVDSAGNRGSRPSNVVRTDPISILAIPFVFATRRSRLWYLLHSRPRKGHSNLLG